jgi:hypothetical protein
MKAGERTSKPAFTSNTTVYNTSAISYFDGYCTLAAYGKRRVRAEYVYDEDSIQAEYMEGEKWEKKGAKLCYDLDTNTYYLHVTVVQKRDEEQGEAGNQTVLGVRKSFALAQHIRNLRFLRTLTETWTDTSLSPARERSSGALTC